MSLVITPSYSDTYTTVTALDPHTADSADSVDKFLKLLRAKQI